MQLHHFTDEESEARRTAVLAAFPSVAARWRAPGTRTRRSAESGAPQGPREPAEWRPATRGRARPWALALPGARRRHHHALWTQETAPRPDGVLCLGFRPHRFPAPAPSALRGSSHPSHVGHQSGPGFGHPLTGHGLEKTSFSPGPGQSTIFSLFICVFITNV